MNPAEMSKLLGTISLIDPRVSRRNDEEKAMMALAWLSVIGEEVPYEYAAKCAQDHYRNSSDVFMPVHVVAKWKLDKDRELQKAKTKELGEAPKSQGMPDEVRAKLVEMGLKRP